MHEILTIQLGQRANYLATHFWNTQESYHTFDPAPPSPVDHDIHFRPGIGADGSETYLPRTVIYDLKGGFGSLRKIGRLYEVTGDEGTGGGTWDGNAVIQRQPPITPSTYQQSLDSGLPPPPLTTSTVRYWSDFNRLFYHPRSIIQLNDYSLNSTLMPFEKWESGDDLFNSLDKEHDLLDRDLRLWAEECDRMQGIQMFTGADDAWGGFAARYVERVGDEFGKLGIWVWGLEEGQRSQRDKQLMRTVNAARSLQAISSQASLYIPLSSPPAYFPRYVTLDHTSQWQTSALLSTALESMTLPSRMKAGDHKSGTLDILEAALNVNGNQRIAQLQCTIVDSKGTEGQLSTQPSLQDSRMYHQNQDQPQLGEDSLHDATADSQPLDMNFFPGESQTNDTPHVFGIVESIRKDCEDRNDQEDAEDEGYARKRRRVAGMPLKEKYHSTLQYPLLDSFPNLFPTFSHHITSVAVDASLSTTSRVPHRVKALQKVVGRMVALDEREALSNDLGEIIEAYEEGWDSGSDDDMDDY